MGVPPHTETGTLESQTAKGVITVWKYGVKKNISGLMLGVSG